MRVTAVLRAEHDLILRMLDAEDALVRRIGRGVAVAPERLLAVVEFLTNFADRTHHRKEETLLFPALEREGVSFERGPIVVMLEEHRRGRSIVTSMQEAAARASVGSVEALDEFAEEAEALSVLLRAHIQKEDEVVFRIADRLFDDGNHQALCREFDRLARGGDAELYEHYHTLAARLEEDGSSGRSSQALLVSPRGDRERADRVAPRLLVS